MSITRLISPLTPWNIVYNTNYIAIYCILAVCGLIVIGLNIYVDRKEIIKKMYVRTGIGKECLEGFIIMIVLCVVLMGATIISTG